MTSKLAGICCSIGYDVLTIFISIADVVTDIIVLIDFYNQDRMTFFWLSLSILILAQCSYSLACGTRFNTIDTCGWSAVWLFFCCLPFGTFVGRYLPSLFYMFI